MAKQFYRAFARARSGRGTRINGAAGAVFIAASALLATGCSPKQAEQPAGASSSESAERSPAGIAKDSTGQETTKGRGDAASPAPETHAAPSTEFTGSRGEPTPSGSPDSKSPPAAQTQGDEARRRAESPAAAAAPGRSREAFPGVWVDVDSHSVEFDASVPINAHDPVTPLVYLELVACTPDTKEHETLVVTSVRPAHVHAALLLIGLTPGKPGGWDLKDDVLVPIDATGDEVLVEFVYKDAAGVVKTLRPQEMIVDADTEETFGSKDGGKWVFAGSRTVTRGGVERYDADGAGTLIGLTTFGGEVIAWSRTISPDAAMQEPSWIASPKTTPPVGTDVRVRLSRPMR